MTFPEYNDIIISNQTDDAEIKLIMLPQRAHGAESWVKNRLANGPPRVQSNGCVIYRAALVRSGGLVCEQAQSILQRQDVR